MPCDRCRERGLELECSGPVPPPSNNEHQAALDTLKRRRSLGIFPWIAQRAPRSLSDLVSMLNIDVPSRPAIGNVDARTSDEHVESSVVLTLAEIQPNHPTTAMSAPSINERDLMPTLNPLPAEVDDLDHENINVVFNLLSGFRAVQRRELMDHLILTARQWQAQNPVLVALRPSGIVPPVFPH